jgi:hypothetical protein
MIKKKLLLSLFLAFLFSVSSFAQNAPVDIYIGSTNQLQLNWQNNFVTTAPTTSGSPYEGADHLLLDFNESGWWAYVEYGINGGAGLDLSGQTHLQYAWKSTNADPTVTLVCILTDINGKQSPAVTICSSGNSPSYQLDTIPLSMFGSLAFSDITTISFQVYAGAPWDGTAVGQFYLDAIQFVDYLNVKEGTTNILDYATYDFGSSSVGTSVATKTFTIENLHATTSLTLSGTPKIAISGANASDFTINETSTSSSIAAGGNTTFTITFTPSGSGTRTATISIANDYSENGTYQMDVTGTGIGPEINVKQGTNDIASSGSYDFGSSDVGVATSAITFTIENLGNADLNLTGSPLIDISGTDAADFTVDQTSTSSPVSASGSTTFTVTFTPSSMGPKSAVITIATDDMDEASYVINLTGTTPMPEINVKQGTNDIASSGSYDFGSSDVGVATSAITFTIENLGDGNLNLTGTPLIVVSGTDAADFAVDQTSTSSTVSASGSTTFTVTFTPSSAGAKSAAITIANDDSDEGSYVINLSGTGTTATGLLGSKSANSLEATVGPNPSNGIYTINASEKVDELIVSDCMGNIILNSSGTQIDLGNQTSGVYFLTIISGEKRFFGKLVKN